MQNLQELAKDATKKAKLCLYFLFEGDNKEIVERKYEHEVDGGFKKSCCRVEKTSFRQENKVL